MSGSRRDRHAWKKSERKRTGESDPKKVRLHRERIARNLNRADDRTVGAYVPVVMNARLVFDQEAQVSTLIVSKKEAGWLPFIVDKPEDCHFLLARQNKGFDPDQEALKLKDHVARVRAIGRRCSLEVKVGRARICSSVIDCPYRKWRFNLGLPECTR